MLRRLVTAVAMLAACGGFTALGGCALELTHPPALPELAQRSPQQFLVVTVRNDLAQSLVSAGSSPRGYEGTGSYGVTAAAGRAVRGLEHDYGLASVASWPIASLQVHCVMFRLPAAATPATLVARLERDPRVDSVEPLGEFHTEGSALTDESSAWMPYNDPYGHLQLSLRELGVISAQQRTRGAGIRIAIIDTGIDYTHPDLSGRVVAHRNFVDTDEAAFRADLHGTAVAGVIAAVADNGLGIVGIAPESHLLAYKACWQAAANGAHAVCNSFTLAQALEAAIAAHADVVNLSLAGPADPLLTRLIGVGVRQGVVFVGAAAADARTSFPASLDPVLPVAAAETAPPDAHDLRAPGRDILTLVPGGHYDFSSGSSLAAAEVTGIVALLLAEQPRLPAARLRALLAASATQIERIERIERARDSERGPSGASVNACAALRLAHSAQSCPPG